MRTAIAVILLVLLCGSCFAEDGKVKVEEWVNGDSYISIGEQFYNVYVVKTLQNQFITNLYLCMYLGMTSSSLKICIKQTEAVSMPKSEEQPYMTPQKEEQENIILELPLNSKKQALLKTKIIYNSLAMITTGSPPPLMEKELLITVVDDFGRIKVGKYKVE